VIKDVLAGYESTVFAYGQTGTGKTHTMEGDITSEEHMGVIPRASKEIFAALQKEQYFDSNVTVSYLEIYNEELADLLVDQEITTAKQNKPLSKLEQKQAKQSELMICEEKGKRGKGMYCRGLSEVQVKTAEDILGVLQGASERRQVGETKMNKSSSRSHCLFTLTVATKERTVDGMVMERTGKLHMVDLAGSECAKTAGNSTSTKERERKNINQSLLTLGRVITALREKAGRIPYRDSKLTRLLQESLGGRCKTVIIATVSPSVLCCEETLSTLSYAQRAHGIKTKPVSSLRCIAGVPGAGAGAAGGGELDAWQTQEGVTMDTFRQMETRLQYMEAQVSEAQGALGRKHDQMKVAVEEAGELRTRLVSIQDEVAEANESLQAAEAEREEVKEELRGTAEKLGETTVLLEARVVTEDKLLTEGCALLENVDEAMVDGDELHGQVQKLHQEEQVRREAAAAHATTSAEALAGLNAAVTKCEEEQATSRQGLAEVIGDMGEQGKTHVQTAQAAVDELTAGLSTGTTELQEKIGNHEKALQSLLATLATKTTGGASDVELQLKNHAKRVHESLAELLKGVAGGDTAIGEWADSALARQTEGAQSAETARIARDDMLKVLAKQADEGAIALHTSIEGVTTHVDGSLDLTGKQDELATAQADSINACGDRLTTQRAAAQEQMLAIKTRVDEIRCAHNDVSTASGAQIDKELQSIEKLVVDSLAAQQQTLVAQREEVTKALARLKQDTKDEELAGQISCAEKAIDESTKEQLERLEQQQQALAKALVRLNDGVAMREEHASLIAEGKEAVSKMTTEQTGILEKQQEALHNVCTGLDATLEEGAVGAGECPALQSELKALGEAVDSTGEQQRTMLAAQEEAIAAQQKALDAAKEEQAEQGKALVASVVESMNEMLQTKMEEMTATFEARVAAMGKQRESMDERNEAIRTHGVDSRDTFHKKRTAAEEQACSWAKTVNNMATALREETIPRAVEVVANLASANEADATHRAALGEQVKCMGECSEDVDAQVREGGISLSKTVVTQFGEMQQKHQGAAVEQQAAVKVWSEGSHETVRAMGVAIEQNGEASSAATVLGEAHSSQTATALCTDSSALAAWKVSGTTTTEALNTVAKSVLAVEEKLAENHAAVQGVGEVGASGTIAGLTKLSEAMSKVREQQRGALDTIRSANEAVAKQLGDEIRQPLAEATTAMLEHSQQDSEAVAAGWAEEGKALGEMRLACVPVLATATTQAKDLGTAVDADGSSMAACIKAMVKGVDACREEASTQLNTMTEEHDARCDVLTSAASSVQAGMHTNGAARVEEVDKAVSNYSSLSTAQAEQLRAQCAAQHAGLAVLGESTSVFCKGPLRMEEKVPTAPLRKAFTVNRVLSRTASDREVLAAAKNTDNNTAVAVQQKQSETEHESSVAVPLESENQPPNMSPTKTAPGKRAVAKQAAHLTAPTRASPKKSKSIGHAKSAVPGGTKVTGMRAPRTRRASTTD
jgi:kinesin family protein 11